MNDMVWRLVKGPAKNIVQLREAGSGVPLYCISGVTGDLCGFVELVPLLRDMPVFGLQFTINDFQTLEDADLCSIATRYSQLIFRHAKSKHISLAGYSAGAVIAVVVAENLRKFGVTTELLIAIDGAPCNTGYELSCWNPICLVRKIRNARNWLRWYFRNSNKKQSAIMKIVDGDFRGKIFDRSLSCELPRKDSAEMLAKIVQRLLSSIEIYSPKRTYEGEVLALQASVQPLLRNCQYGRIWYFMAKTRAIEFLGHHSSFARAEKATITTVSKAINERFAVMGKLSEKRDSLP